MSPFALIPAFPIHSTIKKVGCLGAFLCCALWAHAQSARVSNDSLRPRLYKHVVKAGYTHWGNAAASGAYEFRLSAKHSITTGFSWVRHLPLSQQLPLPGDVNLYYSSLKQELWYEDYEFDIKVGETLEYSSDRDLGYDNDRLPLTSHVIDLGWRFNIPAGRRCFFLLEPGIHMVRHYYLTQRLQHEQLGQERFVNELNNEYDLYFQVNTITRYKTSQQLRDQVKWLPGISYQLGIGFMLSPRISLELRSGGMAVPESPYESPRDAPVRPIQFRHSAYLGFAF